MDHIIADALDLKKLDLPSSPAIVEIRVFPYEDWTGDEALEVIALMDDRTTDDELTGENVVRIKSAIRDSLFHRGVKLFPYIRMIKQSDYDLEAARE